MTDTKKIAALAAELTRLGKMPNWVSIGRVTGRPLIEAADSYDDLEVMPEAVLAALSGVAAKVIAEKGFCIVRSGTTGEWDEDGEQFTYNAWVWELFDWGWENGSTLIEQYPSYEEAAIAALKQVETEKKQ